MQVKFINSAIDAAQHSSPLHGLPHVSDPSDGIVEYAYRKHHPAFQWLPTKLAEWIGENLQDDFGLH